MTMYTDITLCLTIGRRPVLLKQTLHSIYKLASFADVIAINDFRDEPTNVMFKQLCPNGQLICLDDQVGHHSAVDAMYECVTTPYILHCEDDWLFDERLCLDDAKTLLDNCPNITSVCLRKLSDFDLSVEDKEKVNFSRKGDVRFADLTPLHAQWYGYSFNPHLARISDWKDLGGFSQFKKERHLSRFLRKKGQYVAYLQPGSCEHIGHDDSVANPMRDSSKISKFISRFR